MKKGGYGGILRKTGAAAVLSAAVLSAAGFTYYTLRLFDIFTYRDGVFRVIYLASAMSQLSAAAAMAFCAVCVFVRGNARLCAMPPVFLAAAEIFRAVLCVLTAAYAALDPASTAGNALIYALAVCAAAAVLSCPPLLLIAAALKDGGRRVCRAGLLSVSVFALSLAANLTYIILCNRVALTQLTVDTYAPLRVLPPAVIMFYTLLRLCKAGAPREEK